MSLFSFMAVEVAHEADVSGTRKKNVATRVGNDSFKLSDRRFIDKFRLDKELTQGLIEELRPHIPLTLRSDGIDLETKVLTAIRLLATGSYQESVAESKHLSMAQSSVSSVLHEVLDALNMPNILTKYVAFPPTQNARERTKRVFFQKFGIPGVVGCIDGTHVAIVRPVENEERFYNRKGYHSLNVLIVCDSELIINCIDPSYPGSTHDATVWRYHPLQDHLRSLRIDSGEELFLLGDSGYPLRSTLMTPILHAPTGSPEEHYTTIHVKARNCVERCIGVLKARFRCLLAARLLHYDPVTSAKIVNACAVLHNIAHRAKLPFTPLTREEWEADLRLTRGTSIVSAATEPNHAPHGSDLHQGQEVRDSLVARLWQNRRVDPEFGLRL